MTKNDLTIELFFRNKEIEKLKAEKQKLLKDKETLENLWDELFYLLLDSLDEFEHENEDLFNNLENKAYSLQSLVMTYDKKPTEEGTQ